MSEEENGIVSTPGSESTTAQGYTHISVVLDRSGSMDSIKKEAEGGINNFLREQREHE